MSTEVKIEIQKTALRLPKDLHAEILDAAEFSGRSMNAEIVHRLRKSMDERKKGIASMDDVRIALKGLENRFIEIANIKGDDKFIEVTDEIHKNFEEDAAKKAE